ncbi:UPF0149 family protein [Thalassotalea aquiviva]|uniref:UPF0149 family protein n=1 Tax=Thalassotalea aquiviva TaxID=3242415 RepID=UPI00352B908E
MSTHNSLTFADVQANFGGENFQAHASEIHGLLSGLVCAGYPFEDDAYLAVINDLFNNGEGLSKSLKGFIKSLFGEIWQSIVDQDYSFQLLLPDDDESMEERGTALSSWVQGFNLGFGLEQKENKKLSEDISEIIKDFAEIANLSDELDEDEETEQAYFEILEYVRISSLLCFTELGKKPNSNDNNQTLH